MIEHFFIEIFNNSLNDRIKQKITHPGFSYNNKRNLASLVKMITDSVSEKNGNISIKNEKTALQLCLENFIDLDELIQSLSEFDSSLTDYYKTSQVSFSDGSTVDLKSRNNQQIYENLSSRIYSTRNAIVHSKESEKSKYTPFKDDNSLSKEVPLLRFICEQVIIKTSSIMS